MSSPLRNPADPVENSADNSSDIVFHCRVCFQGLSTGNTGDPQQPPFWLTSCGHIVCASHVFPDGVPVGATDSTYSCPYCEKKGVSLAGIHGGEPPDGLKDYFTPPTDLLENFAGALRFQHDNILRFASHYKALADKLSDKLDNQKSVLLRVKDELLEARELKKENPLLQAKIAKLQEENEQLRAQLSPSPGQSRVAVRRQDQVQTPSDRANTSSFPSSGSPSKRKADTADEGNSRVREFRRELNARHGMPPPAIPIPTTSSLRNPQNPGLQNGLPMEPFLSRENYENPFRDFFQQGNALQRPQKLQLPDDRREFAHPQSQHQGFSSPTQNYQAPLPAPQQHFLSRQQDDPQCFSPNPQFQPHRRDYNNDAQQQGLISCLSPPTTSRNEAQGAINTGRLPSRSSMAELHSGVNMAMSPRGRLSLAPQSSHRHSVSLSNSGYRRDEPTSTGSSGAGPFSTRPSSVATSIGHGGSSRNVFGVQYLQRPQSARPSAAQGSGGLGELLRGSGGFMDRPGLRKTVRRD